MTKLFPGQTLNKPDHDSETQWKNRVCNILLGYFGRDKNLQYKQDMLKSIKYFCDTFEPGILWLIEAEPQSMIHLLKVQIDHAMTSNYHDDSLFSPKILVIVGIMLSLFFKVAPCIVIVSRCVDECLRVDFSHMLRACKIHHTESIDIIVCNQNAGWGNANSFILDSTDMYCCNVFSCLHDWSKLSGIFSAFADWHIVFDWLIMTFLCHRKNHH